MLNTGTLTKDLLVEDPTPILRNRSSASTALLGAGQPDTAHVGDERSSISARR